MMKGALSDYGVPLMLLSNAITACYARLMNIISLMLQHYSVDKGERMLFVLFMR